MTNFDSHKWIREHREGKFNEASFDRAGKPVKGFMPGDRWRNDFDYIGMLRYGAEYEIPEPMYITDPESMKELNELYESFTDVNYHSEAADLGNGIEWLEEAKGTEDVEKAIEFLESFKQACEKSLMRITKGK